MEDLTYQEATDIVEKIMIDSRIREYCTEICKGKCCGGCYTNNDEACHYNEGRRLCCSSYLCTGLTKKFPRKSISLFYKIEECIRKEYYAYQETHGRNRTKNIYFTAPDKLFLEISKFPISIKEDLDSIDIKIIKNTIAKLIRKKQQIYDS